MSKNETSENSKDSTVFTNITYIASYVDELISSACAIGVSDIHIDPKSDHTDIKFRTAGRLLTHDRFKKKYHEEFVGRIKILSRLRTDVHDKNQDGRFYFENKAQGNERVDLRVSILPTFFGENIVIRVLRPELHRDKNFIDLGLSELQSSQILNAINREQGIVIIAGPTGSGKTTTIYTILTYLSKQNKNIVTLEDPIEYVIPGIRQIQVSEPADFGFSKALRALLRQDPDIIIIGEIRDSDTANLAFQASLTGHLVITTIHAEDCAGIYARLSYLGVSKDMMHSMSLMISQRLIDIQDNNTQSKREDGVLDITQQKRIGVFEVIPVEGRTKVTLFQNTFPEYIRKALQKQGILLLEDSIKNIKENTK